ncbi:hypothetical protein C7445_11062 [Alicyclobacillus sacchari]|uniref:Uncharacterized protein n=1 Tax=Alicyclobacillus sacchari TaxID=392010 RepID=A0A4R8LLU8_9BACL|nr:hypothetical protein [Alicyclobacillus sacchari]TDY44017.1 hypothetical protein C7445_11062 [Alicyclobacillus sacchari]GMA58272.1 hypothetical protein GCM10025858_27750 [Alicyclobacillus sacchari]
MTKRPRSQNVQTALTDASNSLNKAENAVQQAVSYPDETLVEQAENALDRARNAIDVTLESENQVAVNRLTDHYQEASETLEEVKEELRD